jgi:phage tail-like protein
LIFASDLRDFVFENETVDLEDFIKNPKISIDQKRISLSPYMRKRVNDIDDIWLHDVVGRYLWIAVVMYGRHEKARIEEIQIEFPGRSILSYLPEIYEEVDEDGFLERFLGVFQTIYEDRSTDIERLAQRFDTDSAEEKELYALAGWLGIESPHVWAPQSLRALLREYFDLIRRRGTREGLKRVLTLFTGTEPFIVEPQEMEEFPKDHPYYDMLRQLYGSGEKKIMILFPEDVAKPRLKEQVLRDLIREMCPAYVPHELVLLKPYIFAGAYSYLGVNTKLGTYGQTRLDGTSAVSFIKI